MRHARYPLAVALGCVLAACAPRHERGPDVNGTWYGTFHKDDFSLAFGISIHADSSDTTASFSSDEQRAFEIPLQRVRLTDSSAHFELVGDGSSYVFEGAIGNDSLNGTMRTGSAEGPFRLARATDAIAVTRKDVSFSNGPVTLSGTLFVPACEPPFPAVVFNHGSGPEARYGSAWMADHFARQGIAALIYDKRGVGASSGDWARSDFNDLAGDCIAAIDRLRSMPEIDTNAIGIYGHSQGGTIGPLIASRSPHVKFVISAAAMGIMPFAQDSFRVHNILVDQDFSQRDVQEAMAYFGSWSGSVSRGEVFTDTLAHADAPWFPYVEPPSATSFLYIYYPAIAFYDPLPYWRKVDVPVLLLYGEADRNTPVDLSEKNIVAALEGAGHHDHQVIRFPNATHEFHVAAKPGDFPWFKATPGYPDSILTWIRRTIANGHQLADPSAGRDHVR
jgi:alpha-beta hydrolase superfamily lysophospholipase